MQEYFSILTNKGIDLLLKAAANKTQIALSKMSVSDDEGDLNQSITTLNGVKHSFSINSLIVDEADPHQLIAEGIINADVGGFYINKAGIYTANDELFAVAKLPRTYKPKLAEGSAKDITIKFIMQVDNAGSVTLKVDNNVVLATRNWVISNFAAKNHNHDERYLKKQDATPQPTANTLVKRDENGDFAGRYVTAGHFKLTAPVQNNLFSDACEILFRQGSNEENNFVRGVGFAELAKAVLSYSDGSEVVTAESPWNGDTNNTWFRGTFKLPGGLLLQFGRTPRLGVEYVFDAVFPIAFTKTMYCGFATPHYVLPDNGVAAPAIDNPTKTGMRIHFHDADSSAHTCYMAIGV